MIYTRLVSAAIAGELVQTKAFLEQGSNPSEKVLTGTLLQSVIKLYLTEIAILLLEYGAEVNTQDKCGCTPLHEAAKSGNTILVELLLASGANPYVCDKNGDTAGMLAESNNFTALASRLHPIFLSTYSNLSFSKINLSKKSINQNDSIHLNKKEYFVTNSMPLLFVNVAQPKVNRNKLEPTRSALLKDQVNNYVHKKFG